jgi:hypothetical protein
MLLHPQRTCAQEQHVLFGVTAKAASSWSGSSDNFFFPVETADLFYPLALRFDDLGKGHGYSVALTADIPVSTITLQFGTEFTKVSLGRTEQGFVGCTDSAVSRPIPVENNYEATFSLAGLSAQLAFPLASEKLFLKGGFGLSSVTSNTFRGYQRLKEPQMCPYLGPDGKPTGKDEVVITEQRLTDFFNSVRADFRAGLEARVLLTTSLSLAPELQIDVPLTTLFNASREEEYKSLGAKTSRLWILSYGVGLKLAL